MPPTDSVQHVYVQISDSVGKRIATFRHIPMNHLRTVETLTTAMYCRRIVYCSVATGVIGIRNRQQSSVSAKPELERVSAVQNFELWVCRIKAFQLS